MRKIVLIIAAIIVFAARSNAEIISGTNADGSSNYAVSIGNDDCFATAQIGEYSGVSISCGKFALSGYYNSPTEPIAPNMPSGIRRGGQS